MPGALIHTPIGLAVNKRRADIIKILAPLSINPNALTGGMNCTPIYWATVRGDIEVIKALIPWTDNPNAPNRDGETPIECAGRHGHTEIVEILRPFVPYHCYCLTLLSTCIKKAKYVELLSGLFIIIIVYVLLALFLARMMKMANLL